MNKTLFALALIIIIGAGAYYFIKPSGAIAPTNDAATNTTQQQTASNQSLGQLVSAGQPVTCTFATTTPAGATTGTVYVANGMVAGDFNSQSQTGPITAHMLVRDNTSYVWTSLSTTGFKSTVTNNGASSGDNKGVDYNAQMAYSCQPWTVDLAKFTLPTNISFMTTSSYTPPPQGAGATGAAPAGAPKGTAAQCAQCNSLPSAQKAQCIAALQC